MKQRTERMAKLVRQIVGSGLRELAPQAHLTITNVLVSPDLRYATLWVSALDPKRYGGARLEKLLSQHRSELQAQLAQHIRGKFVPKIRFQIDDGRHHADRVDELLDELGA